MKRSRSLRKVLLVALAVAVGLGALAYSRYRPILEAARARTLEGSRIVSSPCGSIEYAEKGEGPPVVVVHGAGGGFDQGIELGEDLARAGFRVIAPSRFGYLRTPLPSDATAEAQARAHACLLDALNVRSAGIMGVSAGAPSALQFALLFPERTRALVLLVPGVFALRADQEPPPRGSRATMVLFETALRSDFLFWAAGKVARRTFIRAILGTPPELMDAAAPEEQARVQAILDHILPVTTRRAGLVNDARVVSSPARPAIERIAVPTLAVSTADDLYGTFPVARYAAEHIPGARFIGYPRGGHMLVGCSATASADIAGFLNGVAGK